MMNHAQILHISKHKLALCFLTTLGFRASSSETNINSSFPVRGPD